MIQSKSGRKNIRLLLVIAFLQGMFFTPGGAAGGKRQEKPDRSIKTARRAKTGRESPAVWQGTGQRTKAGGKASGIRQKSEGNARQTKAGGGLPAIG